MDGLPRAAPAKGNRMKEWIFLLGFLSLFLLFTLTSWDYPFVSALYPRILLICGFILLGAKIAFVLKEEKRTDPAGGNPDSSPYPKRMWIYLGSGILYMLLMPTLGFILSSLIILILLLRLFGNNLRITLGVATGVSLILYFIFALALGIPLPKGVIEGLLSSFL